MNALRFATRVVPRVVGKTQFVNTISPRIGVSNTASLPSVVGRVFSTKESGLDQLGSVDHGYENDRIDKVAEPEKRAFTYLMMTSMKFAYASTARLLVVRLLSSISPSAEVLALAFAEFDLSEVETGKALLVTWRGKPIFIRRRTQEEIDEVLAVPMEHLRDQETDEERRISPEFMIIIGICPHLGCVPVADAGDYNGWFCPCHGSHYDLSGRIRKGPAPLNLEVPPYKFIEENVILMG